MRYTVTKQVIGVLGNIWMPDVEAAQVLELSAYDMANLGNPRNRDDVERWLHMHAGDFQSITDFRADFHVDGENIVHEWTRGEESVMAFNDAMYGHIDAED